MADIIPGSSEFKETARRALIKIEFRKNNAIGVQRTTIGVVLVSGNVLVSGHRRFFVIAPSAKFRYTDAKEFTIRARFYNGNVKKFELQQVIIGEDIAFFELDITATNVNPMDVNEMEISEVPLEIHETIYLFSHAKGGILPPGNVTSTGPDFFRHECPSPDPLEIKTVQGTNVPYIHSGGILLNAAGQLVGIAQENENDFTDRAIAMDSAAIIQQLVNNNESLAEFIERIRGEINLP